MKRVLFLCIGNAVRSQMAEAFGRLYGRGVIRASSAGLAPASVIAPFTRQVMLERSISLDDHFPKPISLIDLSDIDLLVNMTGGPLIADYHLPIEEWRVEDPMGQSIDKFRTTAVEIETRVMRLIAALRQGASPARPQAAYASPQQPQQQHQQQPRRTTPPPKFGRPRPPRP